MLSWVHTWDHDVFFFFQNLQCPALDVLLGFPTLFGETVFLLTLATLLILFLDRDRPAEKIMTCAVALLVTYWAVFCLKDFFGRLRPSDFWHGVSMTFGKARLASMPSGHTAATFAVATILNLLYSQKMPWLYAVAAWVGVTRIYTGVHYPTDVVVGAGVGIACAVLTQKLLKFHGTRTARH